MSHSQSPFPALDCTQRTARPVLFVVGALCLGAAPDALPAQSDTIPKAETILDRYIEATGGRVAHEKIRNRVTKERVEFVGMGIEDKAVLYEASPNKRFFIAESETLGTAMNGVHGEIVWYLSDQMGPLVESGEARAAGLENAAFDLLLNWRDHFKQVECAGIETIDGRGCYKVVMTPNHGEPQTRFFDKQTHLLIRTISTRLSSTMPPIKIEMSYEDYQPADGVSISRRQTQRYEMCGSLHELRFIADSIQHNVELPADRFDPPAAIVEQAKKIASGEVVLPASPRGCGKPGVQEEPAGAPQPGCKPKSESGAGSDKADRP